MSIKFDCWDEHYKYPFGAVSTNESVRLTLDIPCHYSIDHIAVIVRDDTKQNLIFPMSLYAHTDDVNTYTTSFSLSKPSIYFYRFEIHLVGGTTLHGGCSHHKLVTGEWLPEFQLTVYTPTPPVVWGQGATMYQIFPDRFKRSHATSIGPAPQHRIVREDWGGLPDSPHLKSPYHANDFFMGNLLGIVEQIDYLRSLHINILYLNPIFESAHNHRYSTSNYLAVDPYLGSNEDFVTLTTTCHAYDIKVLLDGVFNHTGSDSVYFNKDGHYTSLGAYQSTNSPYYDWYYFDAFPHHYQSWWGFDTLPKVNTGSVSYQNFILQKDTGVLHFWQQKGADGYRLDVVDELSDSFLDAIRARVKDYDAQALILGEVWEDASTKESYHHRRRYLLGQQLDSVMNYPWRQAIIDFVQSGNGTTFYYAIMHLLENYPPSAIHCLMNSLSTHDTSRILTVLGESEFISKEARPFHQLTPEAYDKAVFKSLFASFLQFTLPGIPCIYYGDEVGIQGFEDPFCRLCYPYGNENTMLLAHYQALAALRSSHKDAFSAMLHFVYVSNGCIAFKRHNLYCLCNLSLTPHYLMLTDTVACLFANKEPIRSCYGVILPPECYCILEAQL